MLGRIALYGTLLFSGLALVLILFAVEYRHMLTEGLPALVSKPTALTTDVWGIFDPETGRVLQSEQENTVRPIASITKLFTAHAVMESDKRHREFTIAWADLEAEGRSKLVAGTATTPYALLFPLLIESSNDAAAAIRRALGSDLTRATATLADTIPLSETAIVDASGLNAGNVSTVSELALFYAYVKRTHPHVLDISRLRMYVTDDTGYVNNNPAREIRYFTGGKNGYTPEAGRTFIGTFEANGKEVGIVLLGSSDITADIEQLLAFAAPGIMTK